MKASARKFVFLSFVGVFCVCAPLLVLYTAGYRYNYASGQVMQTGVLSAISVPRGAEIFIDGRKQRSKTPAVIDNVFPGEHEIRLEKPGFLPWQKKIKILPRQTAFIEQVALYLDGEPRQLPVDNIERLYKSPNSQAFAYLTSNDGWSELWLFDTGKSGARLLSRLRQNKDLTNLELAWSADGSYLSFQGQVLSIINTATAQNYDFPEIQGGFWDAGRGDTYYFFHDLKLNSLRLPERSVSQIELKASVVQSAGADLLTAQNIDDRAVVARERENASQIHAYLPLGQYAFLPSPNENIIFLRDNQRERIFLIDAKSSEQPILLNSVAVLWQWSPEGRRLLYSDGFDLRIYHLEGHSDQTLTRLSRPITGLSWYPPARSVLFSQADRLAAVDLDQHEGYSLTILAEGEDFRDLHVSRSGKAAYFYGRIAGEEGIWEKKLK